MFAHTLQARYSRCCSLGSLILVGAGQSRRASEPGSHRASGGGHCNGAMVFEKEARPCCLGSRNHQREGKIPYIILSRRSRERIGDGVSGKAQGNTWKSDVRITRGGKRLRWCINTPSMKDPNLPTRSAKGWVSLRSRRRRARVPSDLAQEKIAYRPVMVDLPMQSQPCAHKAPELNGEEGKAWATTMLRRWSNSRRSPPKSESSLSVGPWPNHAPADGRPRSWFLECTVAQRGRAAELVVRRRRRGTGCRDRLAESPLMASSPVSLRTEGERWQALNLGHCTGAAVVGRRVSRFSCRCGRCGSGCLARR